jgi:hypothetical protein
MANFTGETVGSSKDLSVRDDRAAHAGSNGDQDTVWRASQASMRLQGSIIEYVSITA